MNRPPNNDIIKTVNTFFEDPKLLIDKNIYKFLFKLLYYIFIQSDKQVKIRNEIEPYINAINRDWIRNRDDYISDEYSGRNLINIVKFVKIQNALYAGEIIENILIMIFSFAFQTEKENTFGKFLYNNIAKLKDSKDDSLINWINNDKLKGELSEMRKLLKNDITTEEYDFLSRMQDKPIFKFLLEIYLEKNVRKKLDRENIMNYLNRRIFDIDNKKKQKDNAKNDGTQTKVDSVCSITSYNLISNYCSVSGQIGQTRKSPIPLLKALFISIYIFYQNKNSPLMKYIREEKNLQKISFVYELSEAVIETRFAGIVLSPLRIEPRVEEMNLAKNTFRENGFLELAKIFLFNSKSIKKIDCHTNLLKTFFVDFLNMRLGLFDNYSVEELNLSYNYLREDSGEYLANILSHFKNLKTLNLTSNELKSGIGPFIITLKNLYKEGKTKLENLNLNNCALDDIAYYEIGELLKSKFCKLKKLYLNKNNIPSNVNFLQKLKKNRSLTQIYFNTSNINNNNADDLMRIISNTNIEFLYLFKNNINDFTNLLRIIYRTKLIKKE